MSAPREKSTIGLFINGIPSGATSHELEQVFASKLPAHFNIIRAQLTAKGDVGFVDLSDTESVAWCLSNGPWILNGHELKVDEKRPPRKDEYRSRPGMRDPDFAC